MDVLFAEVLLISFVSSLLQHSFFAEASLIQRTSWILAAPAYQSGKSEMTEVGGWYQRDVFS